eukprot:SAG22_NODE_749_length_7484_cov_3.144347_2_plen_132_part_00
MEHLGTLIATLKKEQIDWIADIQDHEWQLPAAPPASARQQLVDGFNGEISNAQVANLPAIDDKFQATIEATLEEIFDEDQPNYEADEEDIFRYSSAQGGRGRRKERRRRRSRHTLESNVTYSRIRVQTVYA